MKLIVENKADNTLVQVFDISYDKSGYPHFLVYKDGQWVRMSAKHFKPIVTEYSPTGDVLRG